MASLYAFVLMQDLQLTREASVVRNHRTPHAEYFFGSVRCRIVFLSSVSLRIGIGESSSNAFGLPGDFGIAAPYGISSRITRAIDGEANTEACLFQHW